MRLIVFAFILGFLSNSPCFGEEVDGDFQVNFSVAKRHLAQKRIMRALPYLTYLLKQHPNNANLKYLIGSCYVEAEINNRKTIELLESASAKVSMEYNADDPTEDRASILVYHYLSVAYAQYHLCEEARQTRSDFLEVYSREDQFYEQESKDWIEKCENAEGVLKEKSIPFFPTFKPYVSAKYKPSEAEHKEEEPEKQPKSKDRILTKTVEYSTNYPIYGIQLGAFNEAIKVNRYHDLKNVDAFLDKEGWIRYVMGHFSIHSQAKSLLEAVKEKGYTDAFIVNINDKKRYHEEIISIDNLSIKAGKTNKVEYKVQIGAFKEQLSMKDSEIYFKIEGVKESYRDDITYLMVGKFDKYPEAKALEVEIKESGYSDAFVVAFLNGKKIPMEHASEF